MKAFLDAGEAGLRVSLGHGQQFRHALLVAEVLRLCSWSWVRYRLLSQGSWPSWSGDGVIEGVLLLSHARVISYLDLDLSL